MFAYADTAATSGNGFTSFIPLILLIVVMYFLLIRPQRKKDKEVKEMRNNLSVGDEVITIGGIKGKVVKTTEDTIVIQVGADKVKFEMMRWAISSVVTSKNKSASEKPAKKAEDKEEAPQEKKALPKKLKKEEAPKEEEPKAEEK